jgi:myosin heavy subunit
MSEKKARPPRPSDHPPEDLKKERDAFIQQFFRKGAQLTEELLKENERLRTQIADLERDNQELRAHVASDEAIRELLRKIAVLEDEKHQLVSRTNAIAARTDEFSSRYSEVENELADLANLYVATSQLHSAVTFRESDTSKGSLQDPAALIPLLMDGKALGVIAVFATLTQKTGFVHADEELFNVLRSQAAPALVNARLFTDAGRKVPGLGAFMDLED